VTTSATTSWAATNSSLGASSASGAGGGGSARRGERFAGARFAVDGAVVPLAAPAVVAFVAACLCVDAFAVAVVASPPPGEDFLPFGSAVVALFIAAAELAVDFLVGEAGVAEADFLAVAACFLPGAASPSPPVGPRPSSRPSAPPSPTSTS